MLDFTKAHKNRQTANHTISNEDRFNNLVSSSHITQKSKIQAIKSVSTMPSKNYIQINGASEKSEDQPNIQNKTRNDSQKRNSWRPKKFSSQRSLKICFQNENEDIAKRFYNAKKENIEKKSYIRRGEIQNNSKINLGQIIEAREKNINPGKIHETKSHTKSEIQKERIEKLSQQNYRLRSSLLDYKIREREQAEQINRLQKLCLRLEQFIDNKKSSSKMKKQEQQYLNVVQSAFKDCFGLEDLKAIWKQQKRILKQWMHYRAKQQILRNNQTSQLEKSNSWKRVPQMKIRGKADRNNQISPNKIRIQESVWSSNGSDYSFSILNQN